MSSSTAGKVFTIYSIVFSIAAIIFLLPGIRNLPVTITTLLVVIITVIVLSVIAFYRIIKLEFNERKLIKAVFIIFILFLLLVILVHTSFSMPTDVNAVLIYTSIIIPIVIGMIYLRLTKGLN